jgi:hypothetical protein
LIEKNQKNPYFFLKEKVSKKNFNSLRWVLLGVSAETDGKRMKFSGP